MSDIDPLDQQNNCRVCGIDLGESIIDARANDVICSSCGIHYGYDDTAGGESAWRENIYKTWRDHWFKNDSKPIYSKETIVEIIQSARLK